MTPEENRSASNIILLCIPHAQEVDTPANEVRFPASLLRELKEKQLLSASGGTKLTDTQARYVVDVSDSLEGSFYSASGGMGGVGPGAGGGGGGAAGPGATGGAGGPGGSVDAAALVELFTHLGSDSLGQLGGKGGDGGWGADAGGGGGGGGPGAPGGKGGDAGPATAEGIASTQFITKVDDVSDVPALTSESLMCPALFALTSGQTVPSMGLYVIQGGLNQWSLSQVDVDVIRIALAVYLDAPDLSVGFYQVDVEAFASDGELVDTSVCGMKVESVGSLSSVTGFIEVAIPALPGRIQIRARHASRTLNAFHVLVQT